MRQQHPDLPGRHGLCRRERQLQRARQHHVYFNGSNVTGEIEDYYAKFAEG
jgi:hypothetical protein